MNVILLVSILIFIVVIVFYFNRNHKKEIFFETFEKHSLPALIISNKTRRIIWYNKTFKMHFDTIQKGDPISKLNPVFMLSHIKITSKKNEWVANNIYFDNETGIVLSLTNKCDFKWWLDLPFPIATLSSKYEIEDENEYFKSLINKSQYKNNIEELRNIMEIAKHNSNHEIILHSSEGVYPSKIWISPYKDKHIIFIENRIEYIKLKNKAQESQHLQILGQLTSSIIHDFNNLLTCICGFTEALEEKLPMDESLQQIKKNIQQATNLSEELLNFIKEKPLENTQIEPKNYIPRMKNMLQKLLGSKIKLEVNANTNGYVKLSETQLERILLNMVINSKDVLPEGGLFKINTSEQHISTHMKISEGKVLNPGTYYVIDVADNGSGIPPQHVNKIFHAFFTTKRKGTGLGLSSCLKIAEHVGGTIKLTTSQKGTMFSIVLPLVKKIEVEEKVQENILETVIFDQKTAQNDQNIVENGQKTIEKQAIILVEDNEPIKNLIKKSLERQYIIYAYGDGKEALEAIETKKFHCLITDVVLPEIGGIQLAHAAKDKDQDIKVCLVSGYDLKSIESELPPDAVYIGKPFTLNKLKETINNLLS